MSELSRLLARIRVREPPQSSVFGLLIIISFLGDRLESIHRLDWLPARSFRPNVASCFMAQCYIVEKAGTWQNKHFSSAFLESG